MVLYCLAYRPRRYSEVQQHIEGISQKVLTQTLRKLERHGLVTRRILSGVPERVEYALSPIGKSLIEPLLLLGSWSREHFPEIVEARERYDRLK
ncbi:MAG: winged helix-turn-helix transcriptional regulator [Phormidesmis sp.]